MGVGRGGVGSKSSRAARFELCHSPQQRLGESCSRQMPTPVLMATSMLTFAAAPAGLLLLESRARASAWPSPPPPPPLWPPEARRWPGRRRATKAACSPPTPRCALTRATICALLLPRGSTPCSRAVALMSRQSASFACGAPRPFKYTFDYTSCFFFKCKARCLPFVLPLIPGKRGKNEDASSTSKRWWLWLWWW